MKMGGGGGARGRGQGGDSREGGAQRPILNVPKLKLWMLAGNKRVERPKPASSK
jgi:hypothetical protein